MQSQYTQQPADPSTLLNKVKSLSDDVRTLKAKREGPLAMAHNAMLESNTQKEEENTKGAVDEIQREISIGFLNVKDGIRRIKETPGSGDRSVQSHVEVLARNISAELQQNQKDQMEYRRRLTEQVRRRVQITNPEASPEEVDQNVEAIVAGTAQSFQVSGARTQRANDVRSAVQARSAAIRKIERDMEDMSKLTQEIAELVHQQEPAVQQINQGAENVATDLQNANTQLGHAVTSARNARKWKWYALLIVIIIIAIIVAVAVGVTQSK
ncbi:t-SNARE [Aspergillus californicus]